MNEALESRATQLLGLETSSTATRFVAHVGPSMNPTLSEADLLEVAPYGDRPIRAGDVILCRPPGADHLVVHRVIAVDRMVSAPAGTIIPWLIAGCWSRMR